MRTILRKIDVWLHSEVEMKLLTGETVRLTGREFSNHFLGAAILTAFVLLGFMLM